MNQLGCFEVLLDFDGFSGATLLAQSVIQAAKFWTAWSRSEEASGWEVVRACDH